MSAPAADSRAAALAALAWLVEAGADEALATAPRDRLTPPPAAATPAARPDTAATRPRDARPQDTPPREVPRPRAPARGTEAPPTWQPERRALRGHETALAEAEHAARGADSLEALYQAIQGFEGCDLRLTAKHTVICRGNPEAKLMLIGEAPGRDEDLQGQPFVGAAGQLLDAMLRAAGYDPASDVYISNILFWRPPGNRTPHEHEIQLCLPFIERHIELIAPRHLMFLGGTPAKTLLAESRGITRLRGQWFAYQHAGLPAPLPAMPMFHPAYLLRQPAQKRLAWRDLLSFRTLVESGVDPLHAR
jgi:DNA polymerase